MTAPIRLQISRREGGNLQDHSMAINGLPAVNVTRPGKWGNPWVIGQNAIPDAQEAVRMFSAAVLGFHINNSFCKPSAHPDSYIGKIICDAPSELIGKNLVCFCALDAPCHADVLLKLANAKDRTK
jgi:hypothetical protein